MKNIFRKLAVLVFLIAFSLLFSCTYNWHIEHWSKDILKHQERAKSHSEKGENWAANLESKLAEGAKGFLTNAYVSRGLELLKSKKYDQAISDFTRAIELNPKFGIAYYHRAYAHFEQLQWDKAIADYTRVIELEPKFELAYNERGNAYAAKGDNNRAILDYNEAIVIGSNNPNTYFNRGCTYHHLGQFDKALSDYSKAIEIDPGYSKAYCNRGVVYEKQGKYDLAISDYNKTLEIKPREALAYWGRGRVYSERMQYDQAISDYNKALAIDPKNADAYWDRAVAHYRRKKYDKSREDIYQAEKLGCQITSESIAELRKKLTIAEVLELSGIRKQLDQIPDLYRFMFEEGLKGKLPELSSRINHILPKIANELSCIIYQDSKANLTKNYDQDRLYEVLQWWRSPLGMRICRLEVDATTVGAARKRWQQAHGASPLSENRSALIKRMLELSGAHNMSVQAGITMSAGFFKAMNAYVLQERRLTEDQIQQLAEMAKDVFQKSSEQAALYYTPRTYETISDEELLKYIEFLESNAGRWFSHLGGEIFIKALETSNEEMAHVLFKGSLQKTCVSGN